MVIYDDLTRHADVYRQISLLLRRPVGREAYPETYFICIHVCWSALVGYNQVLFDCVCYSVANCRNFASDVSAYIPTNIISITDGQIFLDGVRHQEGLRPAVDPVFQ